MCLHTCSPSTSLHCSDIFIFLSSVTHLTTREAIKKIKQSRPALAKLEYLRPIPPQILPSHQTLNSVPLTKKKPCSSESISEFHFTPSTDRPDPQMTSHVSLKSNFLDGFILQSSSLKANLSKHHCVLLSLQGCIAKVIGGGVVLNHLHLERSLSLGSLQR